MICALLPSVLRMTPRLTRFSTRARIDGRILGLILIFADQVQPDQHDLVLISGVGSVWPLLRSHLLLNNVHPIMGQTPLVMFYPGRYDGQTLQLFGKLKIIIIIAPSS